MNIGEKQRKFTRMLADLIIWAYDNGYELSVGDAYRDPRVHGLIGEAAGYGKPSSPHKQRLAMQFHLFRDGAYLGTAQDHRPLGEYWQSIGGTWDGEEFNQYSLKYAPPEPGQAGHLKAAL